MAEFQLPDPKKATGTTLGVILVGVVGLLTWSKLAPWLANVAWNTTSAALGIASAAIVISILTSKTFWKRTRIILNGLGQLLFGWFIEMNPFAILESQLDQAEKDREGMARQGEKLKAQQDKLTTALEEEKKNVEQSTEKIRICQDRLRKNPNDEDTAYAMESAANELTNSKTYIENVGPVAADITRLVTFSDKLYRKSGYALANSRLTLKKNRDMYEAVTAGRNAMQKAMHFFNGDSEMNKAGSIAMEKLRTDISSKVGIIKNSIQSLSSIMNERDLADAAKLNLAANKVEELNIDATFENVPMAEIPGRIPAMGSQTNKYLEQLKQQ